MIHAAKIVDQGDTFWFASLDGDEWIGVSVDPRDSTEAAVQRAFDGNGRFRPMRATRGFLQRYGAKFFDR